MAKHWDHPLLGRVRAGDRDGWTTTVKLPAFKTFRYRFRGRQVGHSTVPLSFRTEDEEGALPSKRAIALAVRIVEKQERLADRIRRAVWNDLTGRDPHSGMWWHGDLESVNEDEPDHARSQQRPARIVERIDDLNAILSPPSIAVYESFRPITKPVAVVGFEVTFDEEHGMGVLTDGTKILGIGYSADPSPYRE